MRRASAAAMTPRQIRSSVSRRKLNTTSGQSR